MTLPLSDLERERRRAPVEAAARGLTMPRGLSTERLTLEPIQRHHLPAFAELFAASGSRFLGGPVDEAGAFERMARLSGSWRIYGFGVYAITDRDGDCIGYAGLWFPHDKPDIEIGYALVPSARGMAYASEAVRAVRRAAEMAGVPALVSYVASDNVASQRVAAAAGATIDEELRFGDDIAQVWRYPVAPRTVERREPMVDASVMPLTIATRRLRLMQWAPEHFPRFAAHLADPQTTHFIGGVQSLARASRTFFAAAGAWHLNGYGMYAVEHEGRFVGSVGLYHPLDWPEMELAYNITADARREGFASEAAAAVRDVAAAQGTPRLVSFIDPSNTASLGVAARLGAREVGTVTIKGERLAVYAHAMGEAAERTANLFKLGTAA